jgi:hypothetical protein
MKWEGVLEAAGKGVSKVGNEKGVMDRKKGWSRKVEDPEKGGGGGETMRKDRKGGGAVKEEGQKREMNTK